MRGVSRELETLDKDDGHGSDGETRDGSRSRFSWEFEIAQKGILKGFYLSFGADKR